MNSRDITGAWIEDKAGRVLGELMKFVATGEQLYEEALDIWLLHAADDDAVAAQLYPNDDPAVALAKTLEMRAALQEVHNLNGTLDWAALRRVVNYTQAQMR